MMLRRAGSNRGCSYLARVWVQTVVLTARAGAALSSLAACVLAAVYSRDSDWRC